MEDGKNCVQDLDSVGKMITILIFGLLFSPISSKRYLVETEDVNSASNEARQDYGVLSMGSMIKAMVRD